MADGSDARAALADLHDDYEVIRELGRGGTAVVYLARDRALQRDVAIKVIQPQFTADAEAVARFAREARTVAQLEHANIVTIYAVRRLSETNVALVMQYVPGLTATEALLRDGPFDADRARRVLADVAEALAYAHGQGIVHRDVKPENIFLDERTGRALLSDFGIARTITADGHAPVTMANVAIGTPAYMSPEQLDGSPVDGRSDVYSLGLAGWELLTGRRPWAGEAIYSVIYRQKHEALAPLDVLRPDLPGDLVRAIDVALAKDPRERWASAEHFLGALTGHPPPLPVRRTRRGPARAAGRPWYAPVPAAIANAPTLRWLRAAATPPSASVHRGPASDTVAAGDVPARRRVGNVTTALATHGRRYAPALLAVGIAVVAMFGATLSTAARPAARETREADAARGARVAALAGAVEPRAADSQGGRSDGISPDATPIAGMDLTTRLGPALTGEQQEPEQEPEQESTTSGAAADTAESAPPAPNANADAAAETLAVVGARSLSAPPPVAPPATAPAASPARPSAPPGTAPPETTATVTAPAVTGSAASALPASPPAADAAAAFRRTAIVAVAPGGAHTCALAADGGASCWGGNDRGQLGDGTTTRRATPTPVSGGLRFSAISAGLGHTCAVTGGGAAYCWGRNDRGQLGDGTRVTHPAPVRIVGGASFRSVRTGAAHTCALSTRGDAYCWGSDAFGQLGGGANPGTGLRPVRVAAPEARFVALAVGWNHTCALTTRRNVGCWGQNSAGQLGDGTYDDRAVPEPVAGNRQYDGIAAGAVHSCAVAAGTGEVFCWGKNDHGQLGTGTNADQPHPTRVAGDHRFASVTAGSMHSCALTTSGEAFCWGRNGYGQLGDGTTEDRSAPVRVQTDEPLAAVWASGSHTCATTAAGFTRCWGYNLDGQLGDGTRAHRSRPVAVGSPGG